MNLNDSGSHSISSFYFFLFLIIYIEKLFIASEPPLSFKTQTYILSTILREANNLSLSTLFLLLPPTSNKNHPQHCTMSSSTQHHQPNRSSGWTEQMRDRQARGKNPYSEESDVSDGEPSRLGPQYRASAARPCSADTDSCSPMFETHIERERRGEAMYILDNHAALMAHAQATGDSIAGQRLRFMRQLCGFEDKHDDTSTARSKQSRRASDKISR